VISPSGYSHRNRAEQLLNVPLSYVIKQLLTSPGIHQKDRDRFLPLQHQYLSSMRRNNLENAPLGMACRRKLKRNLPRVKLRGSLPADALSHTVRRRGTNSLGLQHRPSLLLSSQQRSKSWAVGQFPRWFSQGLYLLDTPWIRRLPLCSTIRAHND
jgi:hypothetical protein